MSDGPYPELKNEFFEALEYYDGGGLDLKRLQTIMSSMEDIIKEIQGCVTFWFCERELGKRVMKSMSMLLKSIRVHESERPAFYYESEDNLIPLGGQRYLFSSFLSIISSSQNSEIQPGSFLPDDWCMEAKDAIYEFMRVKKVEKKPKPQPEEEDDDDDEDEENLDEEEDDSDDDLLEDMMMEDGDEDEQSEEELLTVVGLIWNFGINHGMGLKLGTFGLPMDLMRLLKFVRTKKDVDSSTDDFLRTDVGSKLITALMVVLRIPEVAVVCKRADDCVAVIKSLIGGDCAASKYSVSLIWAFLFGRDESQDESLSLLESNPEILEGIIEIAAYELQGDPAPGCDQAGEYDFMVLIRGLCAMSVSDANKSVMKDKISSLLPILYKLLHLFNTNAPHVEPNEEYDGSPGGGGSDHDTMEAVVELLLQLSFLYDEDDELREVYGPSGGGDLEVLGLMQALLAVEDRKVADDTKKNASNLISRLTVKDKAAAAARKASLIPEAADSVTGAKNTKHVMLSYSWAANKPMVVALAKELRKLGVDVWRDEDGSRLVSSMQGATDEKMAEAIDSSSTVIVIVSPEYKESANCRMEGRYANDLSKLGLLKIHYCMINSNYHTRSNPRVSGWLGFMVGDALWYPLWKGDQLASTARSLYNLIDDDAKLDGGETKPPPLALLPPVAGASGGDGGGTPSPENKLPVLSPTAPDGAAPSTPGGRSAASAKASLDPLAEAWSILTNTASAKDPDALKAKLDVEGLSEPTDLPYLDEAALSAFADLLKNVKKRKFLDFMSKVPKEDQ